MTTANPIRDGRAFWKGRALRLERAATKTLMAWGAYVESGEDPDWGAFEDAMGALGEVLEADRVKVRGR